MPLYEYECESCHRRTEVLQRFADEPKTNCDHCEGNLRKLLSAPMVQFKGSGWYVTDYGAKKPATARSEAKGSESGKISEGGNGKTDIAKVEKKSPAAAKPAASGNN
jgi:putative FmdB family regulatory protein